MSNIEKIRQEIERRKKYESENYHDRKADGRPNEAWAESLAIMGELEELLSFIDSLPGEKPSEDFPTSDEEMAKFLATHPKVEVPEKYKTPNWLFDKQPSEDLEEELNKYIDDTFTVDDGVASIQREERHYYLEEDDMIAIARHFAEWQKEQMMKDAVNAEITVGRLPDDWSLAYNPDELQRALLKFKSGDKVKIIIIKEEKA